MAKSTRALALKALNVMYSLWKGMQSKKVKFHHPEDMTFTISYYDVNKKTIPVMNFMLSKGFVSYKQIQGIHEYVLIRLTPKGYKFIDGLDKR